MAKGERFNVVCRNSLSGNHALVNIAASSKLAAKRDALGYLPGPWDVVKITKGNS